MDLYPLFLKLQGRRVLVVGAGSVAERKVRDLLEVGAAVEVVAPRATKAIADLAARGALAWHARPFGARDAEGAWLVVAATSDAAVQRAVADATAAQRTFLVAVDDLPNASAYSGSVLRRAPYTIAISSGGEAPALTRLLREILEQVLPPEEWVAAARALRERWRAQKTPMEARFAELVRAFKERAGK